MPNKKEDLKTVKGALWARISSTRFWLREFNKNGDNSSIRNAKFAFGCFFGFWELLELTHPEVIKEFDEEFREMLEYWEGLESKAA